MASASSSRSDDLTPSTVNDPSRGGSTTATRRATSPPVTSPASTVTSEKPPPGVQVADGLGEGGVPREPDAHPGAEPADLARERLAVGVGGPPDLDRGDLVRRGRGRRLRAGGRPAEGQAEDGGEAEESVRGRANHAGRERAAGGPLGGPTGQGGGRYRGSPKGQRRGREDGGSGRPESNGTPDPLLQMGAPRCPAPPGTPGRGAATPPGGGARPPRPRPIPERRARRGEAFAAVVGAAAGSPQWFSQRWHAGDVRVLRPDWAPRREPARAGPPRAGRPTPRGRRRTGGRGPGSCGRPRRAPRAGRPATPVGHVQLRVGDLPQEEVRDPELAGRADEEVGVGQAVGREVGRDRLLGHGRRVEPPRRGGLRDLAAARAISHRAP